MKKLFCILLVLTIGLTAWGCRKKLPEISRSDVTGIRFRGEHDSVSLSPEEVDTFVKLYSQARYGGMATGEGFTPTYGFFVYFADGTYLIANEQKTNALESSFCDQYGKNLDGQATFYLESEALIAFANSLLEKYFPGQ